MAEDLIGLAAELGRRGEPFALATVVRCERPTSAKPGARALVRADGSMTGWVGGACAEPVVRREALAALRDGQPRLIGLAGEGGRARGAEGIVEYPMTCHSGGTLEIYVEPFLPKPLLVLVGHGPVVETLAALGRAVDHAVEIVDGDAMGETLARLPLTARTSVVVASHGDVDEDALERVLAGDAGYVSLVASRKRAGAVVESLRGRGVSAERLGRLKAPAGLDIGAVTPQEIAVSILAEIVHVQRSAKQEPADPVAVPAGRPSGLHVVAAPQAVDPICGMLVDTATARHRSTVADRTVYFCCARCKELFDADPQKHLARG